jgi:hypothetical protein
LPGWADLIRVRGAIIILFCNSRLPSFNLDKSFMILSLMIMLM